MDSLPEFWESLWDYFAIQASVPPSLFVKLRPGFTPDEANLERIRDILRHEYSARHVPDDVIALESISITLTGKKMEVPVRRILNGRAGGVGRQP